MALALTKSRAQTGSINTAADRKRANSVTLSETAKMTEKYDPDVSKKDEATKSKKGTRVGGMLARITPNFTDYGPPYQENPDGFADLMTCVATHPISKVKLHLLLTEKIDPNLQDATDLYYAPIHWAARNSEYRAIRMLRRAGSSINIQNEFGQTPLIMNTIVKQLSDHRTNQIKAAKFLIQEGADVNIRDKGGYCAIDYAAMNKDKELVQLYLDFGANLLRDNRTFVAPRRSVLEMIADDPKTSKLVYPRYHAQKLALEEKERIAEENARVAAAREASKKFQERTAFKAARSEELRYRRELDEARELQLREDYEQKMWLILQQEEEARKKRLDDERQKTCEWKSNSAGKWRFVPKERIAPALEGIYDASREALKRIRGSRKIDKFNERWRALTGNDIEIDWSADDVFNIPGLDSEEDKESVASYRDGYDDELAGEDLGDVMDALKAV